MELLLIFVLAALLFIPSLGITPPVQSAEKRCLDITQNMLSTGQYLVPELRNKIRPHKPPLFYWMSAGVAKATGKISLVTFRLPSVLAAIGVLIIIGCWCLRIGFGWQNSAFAAASLATTYMFVLHARRASFEMPLTFFCLLCFYACYQLSTSFSWRWGITAAVSFGLAFLTKATPVLVFVPLPVALWLLLQKRLKSTLLNPRFWILLAPAILIALSWYIAIFIREPIARRIIIGQAMLPLGVEDQEVMTATHYASATYFTTRIWRCAFPISLFLPLIAIHAWKERGFPAHSISRLLLIAIAVPFLVFSAIPGKQDHYLLPIYPLIALLGVQSALWAVTCGTRLERRVVDAIVIVGAGCLLVAGALLPFGLRLIGDTSIWTAVMVGAITLGYAAATISLLIRGCRQLAATSTLAGVILITACYFGAIRPVGDAFASGTIRNFPGYAQATWDTKFARFPYLHHFLDVDNTDDPVKKKRNKKARTVQ